MSDSHPAKTAVQINSPAHEAHPVDFNSYVRTCIFVFIAVLCATGLMLWTSFLDPRHYSWALKVGLILAVAACNAFVVAGFLMHLISEKKMVYTVLGFTVVFVICLFALTMYAMQDFPSGTQMH